MLKRLKRFILGNDDPPKQLPIKEEYVVIGEEASAYEIKGDEEIPLPESKIVSKLKLKRREPPLDGEDKPEGEIIKKEEKSESKVVIQKILPKILTVRMKSPHDFENLKKIIDHDVIIINHEDISLEAFEKEFLDFKKYVETLNYSLWRVDDNVILIVRSDVDIDRYKSETVVEGIGSNN
ncbi:MAG TPA: hypothetical protein EYP47_01425 [Methanococcaceae archaeon]|uniref:Uncharacterized protein n=1 Tax=Methanothermococcus okinawensis TaxID=155863 RepID=A0A832ZKI8_9EURY|nr:hypothetical protein [Methanococcaceae archaeon]HIP91167.1 hypothetical protein [Methanothermococcus okinawensis]